jgi:hypothetical protein|tara:strand:+ start:1410 stop:1571 length:162 start_codon:yes stop_codon:yes gene_type:complete
MQTRGVECSVGKTVPSGSREANGGELAAAANGGELAAAVAGARHPGPGVAAAV